MTIWPQRTMVPVSFLKAFEPLEAFPAEERATWTRYVEQARETAREQAPLRPILLSPDVEIGTAVAETEDADVLVRDGRTYLCPHRSRLRLLASVLAFRRSIPSEIAHAFLPRGTTERVTEDLERLRAEHPGWRNHILQSTWDVPIRWFALFADSERQLREDPPGIRYETTMTSARRRARKALGVVRETIANPGIAALVEELAVWLGQFHRESLVVLDYGDVARLFSVPELEADHSARDIWASITALGKGDAERASASYGAAAERWARARARESSN